jgi:hypothetical protein
VVLDLVDILHDEQLFEGHKKHFLPSLTDADATVHDFDLNLAVELGFNAFCQFKLFLRFVRSNLDDHDDSSVFQAVLDGVLDHVKQGQLDLLPLANRLSCEVVLPSQVNLHLPADDRRCKRPDNLLDHCLRFKVLNYLLSVVLLDLHSLDLVLVVKPHDLGRLLHLVDEPKHLLEVGSLVRSYGAVTRRTSLFE